MCVAEEVVREIERRPDLAMRLAAAIAKHIAVPLNVATADELKGLKDNVAELQGEVRGIGGRVDLLEGTVKDLGERIGAMGGKVDALGDRVGSLERAVKDLGERIGAMGGKVDALERAVREIGRRLDALGARWGLASEEAFRAGVRELLAGAGFKVERWTYYDGEGKVYGFPSQVDVDVLVRDGKVIIVEIKSSLGRGDLAVVQRKASLYASVTGRGADAVYVVTYYVSDRNPEELVRLARALGIVVVGPEEAAGQKCA